MKKAAKAALILAGLSLLIGIVSRVFVMPIPDDVHGLEANAFLRFTNTCLLASIALSLLKKSFFLTYFVLNS